MNGLLSLDVAQLGKIAARIESSHDGEALAAARILTRGLARHGLSVVEVIERGVAGNSPAAGRNEPRYNRAPFPAHWGKVDAILDRPDFVAAKLSPRSVHRLQCLRHMPQIDSVTMAWIDGLLEQARDG